MTDIHAERKSLMKLQVENSTQEVLRELAAGDKSMGKLLDDLAPALLAEREHIENGGGDRSPVTAVLRRAMIHRQLREDARDAALAKAGREAYERGEMETMTLAEVEAELRAKGRLSV